MNNSYNICMGAATWITDQDAKPVQYLHYLPYGQLLANQSPSGYDERFKFIGKERDWESGYDYFGARYYISPFLHWMSVDPLSDEDPGISPYAYCRWNPVKNVDPDGSIVQFKSGVSDSFKKDFQMAVQYMNQHKIGGMLRELNQSDNVYYIAEGQQMHSSKFDPNNNTITWSSRTGYLTNTDYELSPVEVLNHEIDHALQYDRNPEQQERDKNTKDAQYKNAEEKRVITTSEQKTAQKIGRLKEGQKTRTNHLGDPYETNSPVSVDGNFNVTSSKLNTQNE